MYRYFLPLHIFVCVCVCISRVHEMLGTNYLNGRIQMRWSKMCIFPFFSPKYVNGISVHGEMWMGFEGNYQNIKRQKIFNVKMMNVNNGWSWCRCRLTVQLTNGTWHAIEFITQSCIENVDGKKDHTQTHTRKCEMREQKITTYDEWRWNHLIISKPPPPPKKKPSTKSMWKLKNRASAQFRNYLFKLSTIRAQLWLYMDMPMTINNETKNDDCSRTLFRLKWLYA